MYYMIDLGGKENLKHIVIKTLYLYNNIVWELIKM